jgi:hypothetical protein
LPNWRIQLDFLEPRVLASQKQWRGMRLLGAVRARHAALKQANAWIVVGTREVVLGVREPYCDTRTSHGAQLFAGLD